MGGKALMVADDECCVCSSDGFEILLIPEVGLALSGKIKELLMRRHRASKIYIYIYIKQNGQSKMKGKKFFFLY